MTSPQAKFTIELLTRRMLYNKIKCIETVQKRLLTSALHTRDGCSQYLKGDIMIKKLFLPLLAAFIFLGLTAYADHSVLTQPGEINVTDALDQAIGNFCSGQNLSEDDIRGKWYCSSTYYRKAENNIWWISLMDPNVIGFRDPLQIHRWFSYKLNAADGTIEETDEFVAYDDPSDPLDWGFMLVPTKDQMQPAEALEKAQALLQEALNCDEDTIHEWRDYMLTGVTDMNSISEKNGRFWYHIWLGYGGYLGSDDGALAWHVYLDANTREIVWQSDPERFAGRWAVQATGVSWYDWYDEELKTYEEKWGDDKTWDYLKHAEFEKHCFGLRYWPEKCYDLPAENEISYEDALIAARAWITKRYPENSWQLQGSALFADIYNEYTVRVVNGKEKVRAWELTFVDENDPRLQEEVLIDPQTGEVL